ncbi:MAG: hypothetical protein JO345_13535 [Streptosporangiaceae bacterium]|nr:hypothetical protein [Streptosporangiaceae bacterium]
MPRRNRVTPYGELIAVADRGMFWGNRGPLIDDDGQLARYSRGKVWMICVLSYKGIRRVQWSPRRLTELYFLDEATALAAGHRPCGECRYRDYQEFKRCWGSVFGGVPRVQDIDGRLHSDRLVGGLRRDKFGSASVRRTFAASASSLPAGAMVSLDGETWLVHGDELLRWTPGGYRERRPVSSVPGDVTVITPRATVSVLAAGYRPVLHPTVLNWPGPPAAALNAMASGAEPAGDVQAERRSGNHRP